MHEYFACMYLWMYICMYVSVCVCVCMWTTCVLMPWRQGEGVRFSRSRVTYSFELPWGCLELNLGLCKSNKCSSMLSPGVPVCEANFPRHTWPISTRPIWLLFKVYQSLYFLLLCISDRHPKHAVLAYGTKKIFPSTFSEAPIFLAYLRITICLSQPQSANFSISLDFKPGFFILILR